MAADPAVFGKMDIINRLAARFGYRRYLEFATSSTGHEYGRIDRTRFNECRRLLYNTPRDFDDGMPIDYRTAGFDVAPLLEAIGSARFDVILVDPWHTYGESRRDLEAALALLEPGGALVVHDCLPVREEIAQPQPRDGEWCGLTYKAFVDFVAARPQLSTVTVDTDYGCGIVRAVAPPLWARLRRAVRRRTFRRWADLGDDDYAAVWRYFTVNRVTLLNLVGVDAFLAGRDGLG